MIDLPSCRVDVGQLSGGAAVSRYAKDTNIDLRKENRPEQEMEDLFREDRRKVDAMMHAEKYLGRVGAFEGAMYEARGYYRPQVDCIMFSRTDYFCKVCKRAIETVIGLYT